MRTPRLSSRWRLLGPHDMGDLVSAPEGGYGRVVLVTSPRVVIVRVPYWHDYLWMWDAATD